MQSEARKPSPNEPPRSLSGFLAHHMPCIRIKISIFFILIIIIRRHRYTFTAACCSMVPTQVGDSFVLPCAFMCCPPCNRDDKTPKFLPENSQRTKQYDKTACVPLACTHE